MVMISGLGGLGGYWLSQHSALARAYQTVVYDQRGTGENADTLPEGYSLTDMAQELHQALLVHGVRRYAVVGHALGGLVGLELALAFPEAVSALVIVNGWLTPSAWTRRCFDTREHLLLDSGPAAWVAAQPLFLYPPQWAQENQPRLEAEEALHNAHFQGTENLLRRLWALKSADYRDAAARITTPVQLICARDDLLVPYTCSQALHDALPVSRLDIMATGGHACNVTAPAVFNSLLLAGLATLTPQPHKETV
ncbi:Possible hydrolase or acyltransferase RutD in novel pyrimidine catabolism pathway [Cronobacter condimenti 1330]|uniref:Putative carbamate hydrolase RutD n=1 Tax=Cronobacter condimenti 1330 TaxID=1073999 RepID=K8AA20_9ENTR|nr:Possible hydrolase or acyltransferase RutD in novel pyrimidine catabolism pathway [Cronobacter condimenti 1330]